MSLCEFVCVCVFLCMCVCAAVGFSMQLLEEEFGDSRRSRCARRRHTHVVCMHVCKQFEC